MSSSNRRASVTAPFKSTWGSQEWQKLKESGVCEAILGIRELSRFGDWRTQEFNEKAPQLREKGFRVVLEWDILMTENRFKACEWVLSQVDFSCVDALRVQDPGAYEYAKSLCEKYPHLRIQWNLETGHHNLAAILGWIENGRQYIERVILSIEIPKKRLLEILPKIPVETELLGLGRILLFYTPRSLVSPFVSSRSTDGEASHQELLEQGVEVTGSSQESPHSGFPIVENRHGTFMFHLKDHCLLENMEELESAGLQWVRLDTRFVDSTEVFSELQDAPNWKAGSERIKSLWPTPTIQGFFRTNKSDVLFKKLKNSRIQRQDKNFAGDVIDVLKNEHMGIMLRSQKQALEVGQKIRIVTPDGKEKRLQVERMWNSSQETLKQVTTDQILFLPHVSGVSVKSLVFFDS